MLSWSYVLQRVKDNLSSPFQGLEKTDDEIVDYMKRTVLKKWEYYYPSVNRITLNTYDENVRVPGKKSTFFLFDPDGRQIKNIKAMYNDMGSILLFGHDAFGAFSYDQVPQIALQNQQANNTLLYSPYNYTVRFRPPNICEISPSFEGECCIEYERETDPELSEIIPDLEDIFCDLCVGMVEMWIGKNRMKFSTYQTQFGEVTVNGESLYNDGKEIYDRVIEKLSSSYMCMNTIFDHG
jgi:hypothetical protein